MTVSDSLSGLVAHLRPGYRARHGDRDLADAVHLLSDGVGSPAGHIVALEGEDLGGGNRFLLWLGVAFDGLAATSSGRDGLGLRASGYLRSGHGAATSVRLLGELANGGCTVVHPSV